MKWLMALVLFVPLTLLAQDYKCIQNGKLVYTNLPCAPPPPKKIVEVEKTAAEIQAEYEREVAENNAAKIRKKAEVERAEQLRIATPVKRDGDKDVQRAAIGAMSIKHAMRDPESFKLDSARVITESGVVCYSYRAKNGFGGMNAEMAILRPDAMGLMTSASDGFFETWAKECSGKAGIESATAIRWFAL